MMNTLWQDHKASIIAAAAAVVVAMASIVVIPETEQAVAVRFGKPVGVYNPYKPGVDFGQTSAGFRLRMPFVDRLVRIDKRMLSVDMERQQVLSRDQLRLEVDAYARFRIVDPIKMVRTAGTSDRVKEQLQPIFTSVLRQELGRVTFQSLLTPERAGVMANIRKGLDREAREYGAQVIDVRIKSADLPGSALESAFNRMSAARAQEATTIRAQGQKNAAIIQAQAEAEAARIYAGSFGKDPAFYDFYRAMQSYEATFNGKDGGASTIILSPDNDYLRQFKGH